MRRPTDPETRNLLKAEIVQHLLAGATLRAVSALPGMPGLARIKSWRGRDLSFDQALGDAGRRGRYLRFAGLDEALARAVIARYAAGESLLSIAADPAMPSIKRITGWRRGQGEFGAEINRLKSINAVTRGQMKIRRPPDMPYDAAIADAILVRVVKGEKLQAMLDGDPTLPNRKAMKRWRRENPEFDAELAFAWRTGVRRRNRARRRKTYGPKLADRIAAGATLTSLGREAKMPATRTLSKWLREDAALAHQIHDACAWRAMALNDQMIDIARTMPGMRLRDLKRLLAPQIRQEARLRNWPARRHRKDR